MRMQIEIAALVALLAVTLIGTAQDVSADTVLDALGISQASGRDNNTPEIDANIAWIDPERFSVTVDGKSETEPRGLFKVRWLQRQVAEIEFLQMSSNYCRERDTAEPCYLVAKVDEHDELKAPLGTWHVTSEDVPDIYMGLPSVGATVNIPTDILRASARQ